MNIIKIVHIPLKRPARYKLLFAFPEKDFIVSEDDARNHISKCNILDQLIRLNPVELFTFQFDNLGRKIGLITL